MKQLRVMAWERVCLPRPLTLFTAGLLFKCLMTTSPFTLLLAEKHFARGCKCRKLRAGSNIVTLLFPIYDFYLVLKSKIRKTRLAPKQLLKK
jgi:hypothetical protein